MLRRILWIFALLALFWLGKRLFGSSRAVAGPRASSKVPTARDGVMVRDRVCNTFLPESSALRTRIDGVDHYFCSERCRKAFLERH